MAARRFEEARGTEGHYREADEIEQWMVRVKSKVKEMEINEELGGSDSRAKSAVVDEFGGERLFDAVVHAPSHSNNHSKHAVIERGQKGLSGKSK